MDRRLSFAIEPLQKRYTLQKRMPARHVHAPPTNPEIDAIRHEIAILSMHCHWQTPMFSQVILDLLAVEPTPQVVDIGCGNGEWLRQLLVCYPEARAHAIDTRRDHLDLTRERLSATGPRVEYLEAALEDVGTWPDLGAVTLMTMLNVLHFIDDGDLEPILQSLVARLAPGGLLLASLAVASPPEWSPQFSELIRRASERAMPVGPAGERLAYLMTQRRDLTARGRWPASSSGFVSHPETRILDVFSRSGLEAVISLARVGEFVLLAGRRPAT